MFSVNDFTLKYENYSDEELLDIYENIEGYSAEAKEALEIVINKKGGLDQILSRLGEKKIVTDEINRIATEAHELGKQGVDADFIKNTTNSTLLSSAHVNEIIEQKYIEVKSEIENKKINPRTIAGSILGGLVASIIGGISIGLIMIYSNKILYIFVIGLAIFCYLIIKAATKQSLKNIIVLLATILSFILAMCLAQFLYSNPHLIGETPK